MAIFGGLLFFPVQFSDGYTCFYHRIFDSDYPVGDHVHNDGLKGDHHSTGLMDAYVGHYAFFWWGSLALLAYCIYRLKRKKPIKDKSL